MMLPDEACKPRLLPVAAVPGHLPRMRLDLDQVDAVVTDGEDVDLVELAIAGRDLEVEPHPAAAAS
jgi:hypothetical protein